MNLDDEQDDFGDLARCDDTLDAGEGAVDPQGPLQKRWLMEQRFVHGLLRAMHSSDAQGRQVRVESILAALPRRSRLRLVARVGLAAAALLVLAGAGAYLVQAFSARPEPVQALPRPEHVVAQALASLREDVDRQYRLSIRSSGQAAAEQSLEFKVTMRPGRRFLVEGHLPFGLPIRAGCDGKVLWLGKLRSLPLEQASRFNALVGDVLDVGYLDLETIVQGLPKDYELRSVRREPPAAPGGDTLIRVEATRLPERLGNRVRAAFLLVEEGTGTVRRFEMHTGGRAGLVERQIAFDYEGLAHRKVEDYSQVR
jgi:hypothetical protein